MPETGIGVLEKPKLPHPTHEIAAYYTGKYNSAEKSDSPELARINLIKMAFPYLLSFRQSDRVLDIGAGKQILERQLRNYFKNKAGRPLQIPIVTLDVANIKYRKLLEKKQKNIHHVLARSEKLPIPDESIALVISSMALDLMPDEAIAEVFRVLKPCSHALITLHHPALIPNDLEELLKKQNVRASERRVYEIWDYLIKNQKLSSDMNTIANRLNKYGFNIATINEARDEKDTWWEIDLIKPEKADENNLWAQEESNL
ncbi:MAG: methyltransferase domain-containing protein [Candidatus Levyibacteriota bacterium]